MAEKSKFSENKQTVERWQASVNSKRGLLFILILFIPVIFFFLYSINSNDTPKNIEGFWARTDGGYTIEIKEVKPEGKLDAAYFNPNPINVGKSSWREQDGCLQLYIELRDKNYPGSTYQLTYDKNSDMLTGTYYQALAKETFDIAFSRLDKK
ncbi:MAG: hypothetical protein R2764_21425 [Bacteroidales bacterium]